MTTFRSLIFILHSSGTALHDYLSKKHSTDLQKVSLSGVNQHLVRSVTYLGDVGVFLHTFSQKVGKKLR